MISKKYTSYDEINRELEILRLEKEKNMTKVVTDKIMKYKVLLQLFPWQVRLKE